MSDISLCSKPSPAFRTASGLAAEQTAELSAEDENRTRDVATPAVRQLRTDAVSHKAFAAFDSDKRISPRLFRSFIVSAANAGASDVTLQTDTHPRIEIDGVLFRLDGRPWSGSEIEDVLGETYGAASGIAEIRGRLCLDYSYEILLEEGERLRTRVNATGIQGRGGTGVEITLRILPDEPPDVSFVGLSAEVVRAMTPKTGLVIIAGATGSGKSSTMAALTRFHLENADSQVKIVDIQAPIEYTYRRLTSRSEGSASIIGQSEVGRHLPDFASGVRSALRRKPHIITVGEARDRETVGAALEAALTGHLVYTTTHAGSVQDCIRRLLAAFPAGEREHRTSDLGACLRFVLVQHLVPGASGGGRTAVREWMNFANGAGEAMLGLPSRKWPRFVLNCMAKRGNCMRFAADTQPLEESAAALLGQGQISEAAAREFTLRRAAQLQ